MAKKIRLDFTKVEERSGWNTKEIPEGVHEMKIVSVEVGEAKDGTDMITYGLVPTNPKYKTRLFPYYCKLQQNQLFKIRDLLVAAGISVPKKALNIDPEAPVGKIVAAEVSDETGQYAGRSSIDGIYDRSIAEDQDDAGDEPDEDEVDEDEEADEVDESEEDFDDEEEADEDDEDEEGDDELREELEGLTLAALRKRAKGLGIDTAGVKQAELVELVLEEELADDEEDEDEDDLDDEELEDEDLDDEELEDDEDEEEEEPEPAPRKRPAARKPAAKPAAKASAKAAPTKRTVKRR